ncbi:MAG: FAD-dependent oxidoreductase [Blastocatellia bacterium]
MTKIAIIGGGPGGLMTAYLMERKCGDCCRATLFEATDRIGGKIRTGKFQSAPVFYEAGVAEVYNYEMIGPDPLRQLIGELGLKTTHPRAFRTCEEILHEVADPAAKKLLKVTAHSDLATEPHLTGGLYGLKNFRMDLPGYVSPCSIEGGMEMLPRALRQKLTQTSVELNSPVIRVEKNWDESYRVHFRDGRRIAHDDFDVIFIALPHNWLNSIEWGDELLCRAMSRHIAYYDRPGHYLCISILFREPFWRNCINGSWFMLDAFGGCCVYDEGARHNEDEYGVLGWLLAGADALSLVNFDDQTLINRAIESLPDELYEAAREHFIEGKEHRWAAAVNAQPDGCPVRDTRSAHWPEPEEHPGIFIVGDYLFDSTLNGVLDSANFATDMVRSRMPTQPLPCIAAA